MHYIRSNGFHIHVWLFQIYLCLVARAFCVIEPQTQSTVSTDFIVILTPRPRLRPSQAKAEPSMTALARPVDSESQSRRKPGQSRGFQAKPGRHITTCSMYDLLHCHLSGHSSGQVKPKPGQS